jgi:hypothetical protein
LILQYSPTSAGENGAFNLLANANYIDQGGSTLTYQAQLSNIPYSSITNNALLMILPNQVSYAILANNVDTASESFTILNVGGANATVPTLTTANLIPNTFPATKGADSCSGTTLTPNGASESCVINFVFGPTATVYTNLAESFQFQYTTGAGVVSAYSFQTFNTALGALISITAESAAQTTGGAITGNGTSGSPYGGSGSFIAVPNSYMWFNITYSNMGTESATSFNVALGNLPIGTQLNSGLTTCPVESATGTLAPSSSCIVSVEIVNPNTLFNPYSSAPAYTIPFPGWTYTESSTGNNSNTSPSCISGSLCGPSNALNGLSSIYTTGTPFATLSAPTLVGPTGSESTGFTESVTFNVTPFAGTVSVTMNPSGTITESPTSCNVVHPATSCGPIVISFPAGSPIESTYFSYVVESGGQTPGITGYFTVTP